MAARAFAWRHYGASRVTLKIVWASKYNSPPIDCSLDYLPSDFVSAVIALVALLQPA